jgi:hypothetical protein
MSPEAKQRVIEAIKARWKQYRKWNCRSWAEYRAKKAAQEKGKVA